MVFTEFLEMVEDVFSPEVADSILTNSDLPSGGVYTALGAYDHDEMVTLVKALSAATNTPIPDLLRAFGKHLFGRFAVSHPQFFTDKSDAFTFLAGVDNYIHVEVRKLYPDAELPKFTYERPNDDTLVMTYQSTRPFADLAEGLIHGCAAHFGEQLSVDRRTISTEPETCVEFSLSRRVAV
jgi:hypothetical protein